MNNKLFNENILERLITAFSSYNESFDIVNILLIAIGIPYVAYFFIKKSALEKNLYPNLFPHEAYFFEKKSLSNWLSLGFVILLFFTYTVILYNDEMSFFKDMDSMSWSRFQKDPLASNILVGITRFFPLGHSEWLVFFSITSSYYLLNSVLVIQFAFVLLLLYKFLNFISINLRLAILSIFMVTSSIFCIFNNQIFTERNSVMLIILALLSFKKFSFTNNYKYLWYGILFCDLTLYFKEINIFFILGILATSLFYNIFIDNFKIKDIFHPISTIKKFPLEFLLFLCCLIFTIFFDLKIWNSSNEYVTSIKDSTSNLYKLYFYDIFMAILCLCIIIYKIVKQKTSLNLIFNEGIFFGGILIIIVLFEKKLLHNDAILRNPYLASISSLCFLIYISINLKSKIIIYSLIVFSTFYNVYANYKYFVQKNEGYHEIFHFLHKEAQKQQSINIFLELKYKKFWGYKILSSAYEVHAPEIQWNFKITSQIGPFDDNTKIIHSDKLNPNDYYIENKLPHDLELKIYLKYPHQKVFENKDFEIYKIQ